MNFGMVPYEGLKQQDFIFPDLEQPWLPGTTNRSPLFYLGLSRWNYKEEEKKKNSPHPQPGTLAFYSNLFNAIEVNITHDEIVPADKIEKWFQSVEAAGFRFCPKLYKGISHTGNIDTHKLGITRQFIGVMQQLKEKLGTSFIQLNEDVHPDSKPKILAYLKELPLGFDLSVELRHPGWFANPDRFRELVMELHGLNKGIVITDTPGRRDAVHMQLSNTTAFIRFNCMGDHELDMFRIDEWKKQLKSWYLQGLEKCYFFLHIQSKEFEDYFIQYAKEILRF